LVFGCSAAKKKQKQKKKNNNFNVYISLSLDMPHVVKDSDKILYDFILIKKSRVL